MPRDIGRGVSKGAVAVFGWRNIAAVPKIGCRGGVFPPAVGLPPRGIWVGAIRESRGLMPYHRDCVGNGTYCVFTILTTILYIAGSRTPRPLRVPGAPSATASPLQAGHFCCTTKVPKNVSGASPLNPRAAKQAGKMDASNLAPSCKHATYGCLAHAASVLGGRRS